MKTIKITVRAPLDRQTLLKIMDDAFDLAAAAENQNATTVEAFWDELASALLVAAPSESGEVGQC